MRIRTTVPALFLIATAAFAGLDVRVGNGDTVTGTLAPAAESETLRALIPQDALISVSVKGVKTKGSAAPAPVVTFALYDPDGNQIGAAGTKPKGTGASLKKALAPKTGEYRVVVTGNGTEGDYTAVVSWASRTSFPLTVQLPGNPKRFEFAADANATASFKVAAGKGNAIPRLFELRDAADLTLLQFPQPADGVKLHLVKNVPLGAGGALSVLVNDTGAGDPFTGSITVKPPKPSKRKLLLNGSVLPPLSGDSVAAVLGADGGLFEAEGIAAIDGASVNVPPGALPGAVAIILGESTPIDPSDVTIAAAGPSVFFGPEGLTFLAGLTATVAVPYDAAAYPGGAGLRVFTRSAAGTVSEITPVTVDPVAHTVSVATSHFSSFQAFGVPAVPSAPPQLAKLTGTALGTGDRLGFSVGVSGDYAIVGAFFGETDGSNPDTGTALIFKQSGGTWTEEATIEADPPAADERFGESVAIDGDTAVVGASTRDLAVTDGGSAIVFGHVNTEWSVRQEIVPNDPVNSGQFGAVVAIAAGRIAVGSPQARDAGNLTKGAVYVFRLDVSQWVQEAKILPTDAAQFGGVGTSIAFDGDTLAFGRGAFNGSSGAVWIYTREGTSWSFQQRLEADVPTNRDDFGKSAIALFGDTLAVAVPRTFQPTPPPPNVYVFKRTNTTWTKDTSFTGASAPLFGNALALTGSKLYVGSPLAAGPAGNNQGLVSIFTDTGAGWIGPTLLRPDDTAPGHNFGGAIAASPEFLLVASIGQNSLTGAAYVFELGGMMMRSR